ncbi:hypothetical protein, partial [Mycoplasmopsis bovis]|uniref:hypothetical protein n=1 Tax=Mycoplasmopsis bovis TaxID=28903 RepID=UPI003D29C0B8
MESKQSNIDKRVKDYKKTNKGKIKYTQVGNDKADFEIKKEIYLNDNDKHIYMSFLHLDAGKTLNNTSLGWQSETVTLG